MSVLEEEVLVVVTATAVLMWGLQALAAAKEEQAALTVRFETEKQELVAKISSLQAELKVSQEDSAKKDTYYTGKLQEAQRSKEAAVAAQEQKQSELWKMTLAVDGELTRVEERLAAEEARQRELVKEFLAKEAELSQGIKALQGDLDAARAQSSQTESYLTGKLSEKETELKKSIATAEASRVQLVDSFERERTELATKISNLSSELQVPGCAFRVGVSR